MDFNHDTGSIEGILELNPNGGTLVITGTNGIVLPVGSTSQRENTTGAVRLNSETGYYEGYSGTAWVPFIGATTNLESLSSLTTTGFVTQTAPGVFSSVTFVGVAGNTAVANGNGTSGSTVTIDLDDISASHTGYAVVNVDTYGRVIGGSNTQAWSTITSTPTTLAGYGITDALSAGAGITSLSANVIANQPAAGNAGAIFYATDTGATYYDNGTTWDLAKPAFTGDVTSPVGSTALTLATVNSNVGTFGDSSHVAQVTVNAKGLVTAASDVLITPAAIGAVATSALGANNGVATLDNNGKLTTSQIPDALVGALQYQGIWNASTNSPTLADGVGTTGFYYKVGVAGTTTIDGQSNWAVGDLIVFNGTTWDGIDGMASEVIAVNGQVGNVALVLASSDFVNQGSTTTFLKGNAAGNPSWSAIDLSTDVTGVLPATQFPALTGDLTTTAGSLATTLATVNSNVGSFGSTTQVGTFTVNAKGLITAASNATIPNAVEITGDATGSGTTSTNTAITLATVNSNVGSFGSSTLIPVLTVNAKGLVTAVSTATVDASSVGAVSNAGGAPSIKEDVFANLPAAGTTGAIFISTDTFAIYRDNGTTWDAIGQVSELYTENSVTPTGNTVTGTNAVAIGDVNTASGNYALATGLEAKASLYGADVRASGKFAAVGDAQNGNYVLRNTTTGATTVDLFLDGAAAKIALSNNSAMTYSALIVGRSATSGFEAAFKIEGLVSRDANAASTALIGTRVRTILTRPNTTWSADVAADTTAGALSFNVTGQATHTIRWVASVTTSEVIN